MVEESNQQQNPPLQQDSPVGININAAQAGMNLNSIIRDIRPGQLSYALNAQLEGFDGNGVTYQNEQANERCWQLPDGYQVVGYHHIIEQGRVVFFLANPSIGGSEIGVGYSSTCTYKTLVNQSCLNFDINFPIPKSVHKITNCGTEIYWPDNNGRRYIDIDNLPYQEVFNGNSTDPCNSTILTSIDCNRLLVQPNFSIPQISLKKVTSDGTIKEGTYQFAIQYCNSLGDAYTSYYSHTNGVPIHDKLKVTPDFNLDANAAIEVQIDGIDNSGIFDYFNLAVIATVNNITTPQLVGTYKINTSSQKIVYTGQSKTSGPDLTIDDIFERYAFYDKAYDITTVQDVLVWRDLETNERLSYQWIASRVNAYWQTWKIANPSEWYGDPITAASLRGYMRDETYTFSLVFLLKNGYQTDEFPLVGRPANDYDLEIIDNADVPPITQCSDPISTPRWKVYNTGNLIGYTPEYLSLSSEEQANSCYKGSYQWGNFAYTESTETYPCNEAVWEDLAGKPIRHFKFPDNIITPFHDAGGIYPIGLRIDMGQIQELINLSPLTADQKSQIAGFKIVRGNRVGNKSVVAKGMIYNVGEYAKNNTNYLYPNYPYNDLREDPLIKKGADAIQGNLILTSFQEVDTVGTNGAVLSNLSVPAGTLTNDGDILTARYTGTMAGNSAVNAFKFFIFRVNGNDEFNFTLLHNNFEVFWSIVVTMTRQSSNSIVGTIKLTLTGSQNTVKSGSFVISPIDLNTPIILQLSGASIGNGVQDSDIIGQTAEVRYAPNTGVLTTSPYLNGFSNSNSRQRFTFHSPDTSFYQPTLGSILKLESAEWGVAQGHFVEVRNHAKYKFPSLGSYLTALGVGIAIGFASGMYGVSDQPFDGAAAFTAFSVMNDIIYKLIPNKNFAYQYNSIGEYTESTPVPNEVGNKIRRIDIGAYLSSGINSVGDIAGINNYQRESSVYLKVNDTLPIPTDFPGVPEDQSRMTISQNGCGDDINIRPISAFYAAVKRSVPDQYGQIGSYNMVDTGFQWFLTGSSAENNQDVFGGDIMINKFAYKSKLPLFLDNRVGFPDNTDVAYDTLGNIGYPTYWFSTDITQGSGGSFGLGSLFGVKVHNFDCSGGSFFYDQGKIVLFAYGIPYFFVESEVNVDFRQAINGKEGEFYPHVSAGIPDDWLQEINVPIAQDNTYVYNKSFSKQNDENVFTHLPVDFIPGQLCTMKYPNKAIYSDPQEDPTYYKKNNWLIYRPVSYKDFPLNYGKMISIDEIGDKEVLARFETRAQVYNALLTLQTSVPQSAYLGNPNLFSSPPIDFAVTDGGYGGSVNKLLLKTEYGHVFVDSVRGNIYLIPKVASYQRRVLQSITDIQFNVPQFFSNNLPFQIAQTFPSYPIDNAFNGVGLHGVYDQKYDRIIITKLDYKVTDPTLKYFSDTNTFRDSTGKLVELGDPAYFCNISFTISFSFLTKSWISFHSYLPNYFIPGPSEFYSGLKGEENDVWRHNTAVNKFNEFYGKTAPYIIEFPFSYKMEDEIVQNVKDYTKVLKYTSDYQSFVETNDTYFNKAWLYNNQQHSGLLNLILSPKNNMLAKIQYPKFNSDSKDILVTKSNSFYNYNQFWDVIKDKTVPTFVSSCNSVSEGKVLIQSNMDYSGRAFKKAPLMAKDLKIRQILDNTSDYKLLSQFIIAPSQKSYK